MALTEQAQQDRRCLDRCYRETRDLFQVWVNHGTYHGNSRMFIGAIIDAILQFSSTFEVADEIRRRNDPAELEMMVSKATTNANGDLVYEVPPDPAIMMFLGLASAFKERGFLAYPGKGYPPELSPLKLAAAAVVNILGPDQTPAMVMHALDHAEQTTRDAELYNQEPAGRA